MNQKEYEEYIEKWKEENKELIESGKCRKVFTEILPREYGLGANTNKLTINWGKIDNNTIHFICEDIEDDLIIVKHFKDKKVLLLYKGNSKIINRDSLCGCHILKIIGKEKINFKFNINDIVNTKKSYLKIIDRKVEKELNKNGHLISIKWYKYHCNKCGNEDWIREGNLLKNVSCNVCTGSKIKFGFNTIYDTDKDMNWKYKYGISESDAKKFSEYSNNKISVTCPNCGLNRTVSIANLYRNKSLNCICKDGFTYPEKFMLNFLNLVINDNFIYQYSKVNSNWCGSKMYDFYFKLNGEEYIIETHGEQHYTNSFKQKDSRTLEQEQQNDKYKRDLAIKNGIKPENYIVIDCRKSEMEWIKNNILRSRLNELFDLNNIDWIKIYKLCEKNIVKEACKIKNKNPDMSTKEIADILKINRTTVKKYINRGYLYGWTDYDFTINKYIKCNENGKVFKSPRECSEKSLEEFGVELQKNSIARCARKERSNYKGFTFEYISRREYERTIC